MTAPFGWASSFSTTRQMPRMDVRGWKLCSKMFKVQFVTRCFSQNIINLSVVGCISPCRLSKQPAIHCIATGDLGFWLQCSLWFDLGKVPFAFQRWQPADQGRRNWHCRWLRQSHLDAFHLGYHQGVGLEPRWTESSSVEDDLGKLCVHPGVLQTPWAPFALLSPVLELPGFSFLLSFLFPIKVD